MLLYIHYMYIMLTHYIHVHVPLGGMFLVGIEAGRQSVGVSKPCSLSRAVSR